MRNTWLCVAVLVAALLTASLPADEPKNGVAFLGVWERSQPVIDRSARELGLRSKNLSPAELASDPRSLEGIGVVFVLNVAPEDVGKVTDALRAARKANPKLQILALDKRPVHANFIKAEVLRTDPRVAPYWRSNGATNVKRLLRYASITYLGGKGAIEPPIAVPEAGYYDPARAEPFEEFDAYRTYKAGQKRWKQGAPVAVMLIQQSFWITEDTRVINAQVAALEKRGINVAVVFADSQERCDRLIRAAKPDLLVEDRHGGRWPRNALESLDVPYLRPISMLALSIEDWMKDPRGLAPRDISHFMTIQESRGTIEPIVVGGLKTSIRGFRLHEPIPERVEHFADRAKAWLDLRAKANKDKKIAIIYYNKSLGKGDLMRGSPTGAFLDGPASLVRFLPFLKKEGYTVEPLPKSSEELLGWIKVRGRNIGPWAQGDLARMVSEGQPVLIPLATYRKWFEAKLSAANKKAVLDKHGPAPGRLMVVTRKGEPYIVLPCIRLGNVLLAPLPERGEKQDERLIHSRAVPPPHNYLAFYWWLQEEYKADAVVHWGTHGTLELLPGKANGLSAECWGDICAGKLPIVNLWIMDNLGEATLSRRRSYALLSDHMVPALVNAGFPDDLRQLHDEIDKFDGLEQGLLKEEFRKKVTAGTRAAGVDVTLKLDASKSLSDAEVAKVAGYLHDVYESTTPVRLHILGTPPPEADIPSYLVKILRRSFLDRLSVVYPVPKGEDRFPGDKYLWLSQKGEQLLKMMVLEKRPAPVKLTPELEKDIAVAREVFAKLHQADHEITGLLKGLNGRYVLPGPGPDPIRNPGCLPGGRNLYALNPEEVPTRPSWEVAVKLVDDLLKTTSPKKVGIDLNGMNTMRDFGVTEAQALYLMGVRPVWDSNNLAVDVELIPRAELKRPRVDVFIAMGSVYKENFPTRVKLLDKAVTLASSVEEVDNGVRLGTLGLEARLLAKGFASKKAKQLSTARIFGTKPGSMGGTGILHLVPRSGVWDKSDEITDVYIDHMSYAYTGELWGEKIDGLYEEAIQGTDVMIRVWASNMTSPLSNHHVYEYLGGMSMAVKKLTGKTPDAMIADVRDPEAARVRGFEEVLATNFRSEILNRKWVVGMKSHGYAGAGHMAELVKNAFGWSVTRPGSVTQQTWNELYAVTVKDKLKVGISEWFDKENPHARQEIMATLLEADRTGVWTIDEATRRELAGLYAASVAQHGQNAGLVSGGNEKLTKHVAGTLNAPGDQPVVAAYRAAIEKSARAASSPDQAGAPESKSGEVVEGVRLDAPSDGDPAGTFQIFGYVIGVAVLALILLGIVMRVGVSDRRGGRT